MAFEFNGVSYETNENGHLANHEDWSEDMARAMATADDIELTGRHWDLINYLRDEYFNGGGVHPNTRAIVKAMGKKWGEKLSQRDVYALFPGDPSKQGGKIAGLPESRRKGGY